MTGGSTAGSTEEPAPVVPDSESDGIVDFDTLKAGYAWLSETTRTTGPDGFYLQPSVEEVVQQLGKAGKVHWPENWTDSVCFYKWMTDDGADFSPSPSNSTTVSGNGPAPPTPTLWRSDRSTLKTKNARPIAIHESGVPICNCLHGQKAEEL